MARATYPVDFETGRSFREPQSGHPVQFTFGIQTLARGNNENLFFKRVRILAKNSAVDQAQNRAEQEPKQVHDHGCYSILLVEEKAVSC